ncbi:MAG: hypothetical protein CMN32_16310 [Saprospirales bacterium]|nr:hypothetical protein [Saprospirales bacterium]
MKIKYAQKKYFQGPMFRGTFVPSKNSLLMIRRLTVILSFVFSFVIGLSGQCIIDNVTAVPGDCENGEFFVTLDFEYVGVSDHFKVQGNGINYGTFSYADLPITLGPLAGDGVTPYEFVVKDLNHPDCQDFVELGPVDCPATGDCSITNLHFEVGPCYSDGTYKLWINFDYENAPNNFFDVIYQGQNIGYFALADLPVFIEHFDDGGNPNPVVAVCINDTPDCCAEADFTPPNCDPCEIWDLEAVASDCENGLFFATINFQHANTGNDGFKLFGNGIEYGIFSYDDLPIQVGPLVGNGVTEYEFIVKDAQNPDCNAEFVLGTVECPPTGDCEIFDAIAEPLECNNDGTYSLLIDFQMANPGNNFFFVKYKGEVVVPHAALANLPIVIEHFEDDGAAAQHVLICINDQPGCCVEAPFESLNCPPPSDCEIFDVIAEAHECENGQFLVDIAFEHAGTGNEGFVIFGNGQVYGEFEYGEPYYTIGPLEGNGQIYEFIIKDLQNPDCKGFTHIGPVYCDDVCHIYDLEAEVSDCDDEGQFYVTLNFEHNGTGDDGFKVVGNGNVYGYFGYDELPVTIGPLETDLEVLEFIVKDVNHPDCHDYTEVHSPDCGGNDDCFIADLVVDVHPCLGNGTFYVSLDFFHENTSGYFKVHGNGINYGVFSYDDLPVTVGPLVGNGITPFEFAVTDIHHPDCHDAVEVGPVDCGATGDCEVFDLIADPGSCHNDDTYNLWVNFEVNNPGNNFYDVFLNGEHLSYYPLNHVPVVIPHVASNDEPVQVLTVCVNDNPTCCDTTEYESPMCNIVNPVWPGDANADFIVNNFDVLNLGLIYGSEGPARDVLGVEWTALEAENWPKYFSSGINHKHADCNGDGKIAAGDIGAVFLNYGLTHGEPQQPVEVGGDEFAPPLYVDLPDGGVPQNGQPFEAPIIFGTEALPLDDAYGLAFTIHFDPGVIDPASIQISYDPSWLGVQGVNLLVLDKKYESEGRVEVALVRTDGNNVSGFGQVAGFIGIIDNIAGKEQVSIDVSNVRAIRQNETLIAVKKVADYADLLTATTEAAERYFSIYPNPASDWLYITPLNGHEIQSWSLRNLDGKTMLTGEKPDGRIDLSSLNDGVYTLLLHSDDKVLVAKVVKL